MTSWNPNQYLQFADERMRPASDRLNNTLTSVPDRVIGLDYRTRNSTALMAARWPTAHLDALENSDTTLARAKKSNTHANWMLADLATCRADATYDVIFSNAGFQWLPNQATLLPRMMGAVSPKGIFAFQVLSDSDAPSYTIIDEITEDARWKEKYKDVRRIQQSTAPANYDILKPHASSLDMWVMEYLHAPTGEDAVCRWIAGTSLRPFGSALGESEREEFVSIYNDKINSDYPRRTDGTTLFRFQRIFVIAVID